MEPEYVTVDGAEPATESKEETKLSDTELCVRYKGTADTRTLSHQDLAGEVTLEETEPDLEWTPGSEVAYAKWEWLAGNDERARQVLKNQAYEFELVGPGAEDFEVGEEEFTFEEGKE